MVKKIIGNLGKCRRVDIMMGIFKDFLGCENKAYMQSNCETMLRSIFFYNNHRIFH